MEKIWYDNGSETYFEDGDRVVWSNSEEEIEGTLKWINTGYFCVKWDDNKIIIYDAIWLDAIKKA